MKHFRLLAEQVFVQPLVEALAAKPALWDVFTDRQNYPGSAHADTRSIILAGPQTLDVWAWFNALGVKMYPAIDELGLPLRSVLHLIRAILWPQCIEQAGRIMLAELKAGGKIAAHVDEGAYAEHFQRLHLVLTGSCEFHCGNEAVTMVPGELWWFDHQQKHRVENEGTSPRVNLIMDIRLDPRIT